MKSPPAFYKLPEELLTAIVQELAPITPTQTQMESRDRHYSITGSAMRDIKALRLTCARFAYLKPLLSILFQSLKLDATPRGLANLMRVGLNVLAPYTTTIIFCPPPNSWSLSYDDFRKILIEQNWEEHAFLIHDWEIGSNASKEERLMKYCPTLKSELEKHVKEAFQTYSEYAEITKELLLGKALRRAWIRTLKSLPKLNKVCFQALQGRGSSDTPLQADCVAFPHFWTSAQRRTPCWEPSAEAGDLVFTVGIECLAESGIIIRHMEISCAMRAFEWDRIPGWNDINFAYLETLGFNPVFAEMDAHDRQPLETIEGAITELLCLLLRCRNNLKYLLLGPDCGWIVWPTVDSPALPKLTHLLIGSSLIDPEVFRAWCPKLPSLVKLRTGCWSYDGHPSRSPRWCSGAVGDGTWKSAFDAIRSHPNPITARFLAVLAHGIFDMYYYPRSMEQSLRASSLNNENLWSNVPKDLFRYLEGEAEWTSDLEAYFG